MKTTHCALAALLLGLAGCGGGGGSSTTTASPGSVNATSVARVTRFRRDDTRRVIGRSAEGGEDADIRANASRATFTSPTTGTVTAPSTGTEDFLVAGTRTYERQEQNGDNVRRDELGIVDLRYARLGTAETISGNINADQIDGRTAYFRASNPADERRPAGALNGRATYAGTAVATTTAESTITTNASVALEADFDRGTIEGTVRGVSTGAEFSTRSYDLELRNGRIDGNEYRGNVRVVDPGTNRTAVATSRADFNGGFYGPNAEETAGLIDVQGRQGGREIDIIGAYGAEAQVPPTVRP